MHPGSTRTSAAGAELAELQKLSVEELFQVAVRAGIYTQDGQLTPPCRGGWAAHPTVPG
jgi:hypothetical protein